MIHQQELNGSPPIEEDHQMEYGFLNEAMDDDETNEDDKPTKVVDDDPDNLDDEA